MTNPTTGNTVAIHYTVRLTDGRVVESTRDGDPVQITLGAHQVMPGIERTILEMTEGEDRTVTIVAENAYGQYDNKLVQTIERSAIPEELDSRLEDGMTLQSQSPQGHDLQLKVVGLSDENVTFDANHPLAGKDLTFDLQLVAIR